MLDIYIYVGFIVLFLNLVLFIRGFSNQVKAYAIFTWYLGIIFAIQIISNALMKMRINNLFLSHFYFIGQFVILSFFYGTILKVKFQKNIVKLGLVIGLFVLGMQYANDTDLFFRFNLFEIFITSFLLIIYATFHFYNMLNEKKEFYYINMGVLLYLFGSTILFLVGNLMIVLSSKMSKITWILNAFLYIIYQLFILVEWRKSFSKKTIQQ
jgi:hypothetical protein